MHRDLKKKVLSHTDHIMSRRRASPYCIDILWGSGLYECGTLERQEEGAYFSLIYASQKSGIVEEIFKVLV